MRNFKVGDNETIPFTGDKRLEKQFEEVGFLFEYFYNFKFI